MQNYLKEKLKTMPEWFLTDLIIQFSGMCILFLISLFLYISLGTRIASQIFLVFATFLTFIFIRTIYYSFSGKYLIINGIVNWVEGINLRNGESIGTKSNNFSDDEQTLSFRFGRFWGRRLHRTRLMQITAKDGSRLNVVIGSSNTKLRKGMKVSIYLPDNIHPYTRNGIVEISGVLKIIPEEEVTQTDKEREEINLPK